MTVSQIETKFRDIVIEQMGVDYDDLKPESNFETDLAADSLDLIEIMMAAEEEFQIQVPDEDADKIKTFGEALAYLKEKLKVGDMSCGQRDKYCEDPGCSVAGCEGDHPWRCDPKVRKQPDGWKGAAKAVEEAKEVAEKTGVPVIFAAQIPQLHPDAWSDLLESQTQHLRDEYHIGFVEYLAAYLKGRANDLEKVHVANKLMTAYWETLVPVDSDYERMRGIYGLLRRAKLALMDTHASKV